MYKVIYRSNGLEAIREIIKIKIWFFGDIRYFGTLL